MEQKKKKMMLNDKIKKLKRKEKKKDIKREGEVYSDYLIYFIFLIKKMVHSLAFCHMRKKGQL